MRELQFLQKMLPRLQGSPDLVVPPGDDCAAVRRKNGMLELLAADQLIGGVHFFSDSTLPEKAGAKLLKRNLSDIAAMGGVPEYALSCVATDWPDETLLRFFDGIESCAASYGVRLVGGDLAGVQPGASGLVASLSIIGSVAENEVVTRSGACPGDVLFVTGTLGNSLATEHHLDFLPRLKEGRFLARGHFADAMLDISDGTLLDLGRLSRASGVAFALDVSALPLRTGATTAGALGDGEDYELLLAVPAEKAEQLSACWPQDFALLTRIGFAFAGAPGVYDLEKKLLEYQKQGFIHGKQK